MNASAATIVWGAPGERFKAETLKRPMARGPHARSAWGARRRSRSAFYTVNKFCFVIHPLSLVDVARYEPGAVGKGAQLFGKLSSRCRLRRVKVTGVRTPDGRETEG